jgi:hypothetical protein
VATTSKRKAKRVVTPRSIERPRSKYLGDDRAEAEAELARRRGLGELAWLEEDRSTAKTDAAGAREWWGYTLWYFTVGQVRRASARGVAAEGQ